MNYTIIIDIYYNLTRVLFISAFRLSSDDSSILTLANVGAGRSRHPNCRGRPQLTERHILLFCGWHVCPSSTFTSTGEPLCCAWIHLLLSCTLYVHAANDLCTHEPACHLMGYPRGGTDQDWERRAGREKGIIFPLNQILNLLIRDWIKQSFKGMIFVLFTNSWIHVYRMNVSGLCFLHPNVFLLILRNES